MLISYRKNKSPPLFHQLASTLGVQSPQNYIPLYTRFFEMNATNWNHINLEGPILESIEVKDDSHSGVVDGKRRPVFFKYCPLIDPSKYISGQVDYDFTLPSLTTTPGAKFSDPNNSAYVDGFFYYLSGRLLREHRFVHGLDFFGAFLGIKQDFKYYGEDDLEHVANHTFFNKNVNRLFTINYDIYDSGSRDAHTRLALDDAPVEDVQVEDVQVEDVEDVEDVQVEDVQVEDVEDVQVEDVEDVQVEDVHIEDALDLNDGNSSTSSNTHSSYASGSEPSEESEGSFSSMGSADMLCITIKQFPVQVVAMEACEKTFDRIMDQLEPDEIFAALMQVIMTLIVYQKVFKFTHNDLHTNNVMYVSTDAPFLYYRYNGKNYKVPTFGRIFKIIDFGRSIYFLNGNKFVSDSFSPEGDASSQYNTTPYLNPAAPPIDPNYSFDLCRLACSMIDAFPNNSTYRPVNNLVEEWCKDTKGRNVMFKRSGEERYPNFKLYKMIARTVHDHTPQAQLSRPEFKRFEAKRFSPACLNIDTLPVFA